MVHFRTIPSVLPALALGLALAACGGGPPSASEASNESSAEAVGSASSGEVIAEYRESLGADLPAYTFTLRGVKPSADSGPARVQAIEIQRGNEARPYQAIGGIDAATPLERPGAFELLDMNFDGYRDMRLIESAPAGPNVPYRNWLFNAAGGEFEPSPELDGIVSAVFDSASRTIRSAWREGAARYGEDTYRYVEGKPVLVRRDERTYSGPGVYTLTVSERLDGEMKFVEAKTVRE